jgi:carbohydrate kinase (thermoresistant glucokinase family)
MNRPADAAAGAKSAPARIVVMGVAGSGKSTVGEALAARLGADFTDSDQLHPPANIQKMSNGIPLDDDDRRPWLDLVGATLAAASGTGIVVACSALRRRYRDRIRLAAPDTVFVHLHGDRSVLAARLGARQGHFMPASLLDSQLRSLEPLDVDEAGVVVELGVPIDEVVDAALAGLSGLRR